MSERRTSRGNIDREDILKRLSKDILAETIEVARLRFEQKMTQQEIAKVMRIAPARVFRRLKLAEDLQLIQTTVVPPPMRQLEEDLLRRLRNRKQIHDVQIVPRGAGKNRAINADNLGAIGAAYLEDVVIHHPGDHLKIAMACGNTLLTLLTRFAARLEHSPSTLWKLKAKEITLYPLNLFWGWKFDGKAAVSPLVLVINTAGLLNRLGLNVLAYTPPPQLSLHHDIEPTSNSEDTKARKKYATYLQEVEQADIFLLGIGTGDSNYREALKELCLTHILKGKKIAGEINYQPYTPAGEFLPIENFPGLQAKRLQEIAKTERKVIAVAGGEEKAESVRVILQKDVPFNTIITDEDIAEKIWWV
jgi:DNA-binding transcriptional regulator LsrR (DeoR family)